MIESNASSMITTEKDAVKIRELLDKEEEIFALKLKPVLDLKGLLDE
jgi:tetraacyldisaccharide-1-P 4'-kinase